MHNSITIYRIVFRSTVKVRHTTLTISKFNYTENSVWYFGIAQFSVQYTDPLLIVIDWYKMVYNYNVCVNYIKSILDFWFFRCIVQCWFFEFSFHSLNFGFLNFQIYIYNIDFSVWILIFRMIHFGFHFYKILVIRFGSIWLKYRILTPS